MPEAICHLVESTWKTPSNIKLCDWLSFGFGERYSSKYFIVIYLSALKQCHTKELVFCIQSRLNIIFTLEIADCELRFFIIHFSSLYFTTTTHCMFKVFV